MKIFFLGSPGKFGRVMALRSDLRAAQGAKVIQGRQVQGFVGFLELPRFEFEVEA